MTQASNESGMQLCVWYIRLDIDITVWPSSSFASCY